MWLYIPSSSAPEWACLEKDCEPGSNTWASRCAPSSTWSGKLTQPQSWLRGAKTEAWTRLLSGPTFAPSTLDAGMEQWIASLPASAVGAAHGRARWFCLAWRVDDAEDRGGRLHARPGRPGRPAADAERAGEPVEQPARQRRAQRRPEPAGQQGRHDAAEHGGAVADSEHRSARNRVAGEASAPHGEVRRGMLRFAGGGGILADADGDGQRERGRARRARAGHAQPVAVERGGVADAGQQGLPHAECEVAGGSRGGIEGRAASELRGAPFLFAPGPGDPRWPDILRAHPELAPALEPTFRCVVDGLAFDMGDSRAARLKCIGNGVVPLQASLAFVLLVRRARGETF